MENIDNQDFTGFDDEDLLDHLWDGDHELLFLDSYLREALRQPEV